MIKGVDQLNDALRTRQASQSYAEMIPGLSVKVQCTGVNGDDELDVSLIVVFAPRFVEPERDESGNYKTPPPPLWRPGERYTTLSSRIQEVELDTNEIFVRADTPVSVTTKALATGLFEKTGRMLEIDGKRIGEIWRLTIGADNLSRTREIR